MGVLAWLLTVAASAAAVAGLGLVVRARRRRGAPPAPTARPIEVIAGDVRRRAARLDALDERASRVRRAALASAYDLVLGECCDALELPHLLGVLDAGRERDAERRRVELLLHSFGLPVAQAH